ncbi:MAG: hypothetical protein QM765_42125 [Myxococcales bacterium]
MRSLPVVLVLLVPVASCAPSDLGASCQIPESIQEAFDNPSSASDPPSSSRSLVYFGAADCDDQVCLQRSGSAAGVCSRACLDERDCGPGWSCETLVPASLRVEGVASGNYCVAR